MIGAEASQILKRDNNFNYIVIRVFIPKTVRRFRSDLGEIRADPTCNQAMVLVAAAEVAIQAVEQAQHQGMKAAATPTFIAMRCAGYKLRLIWLRA